jgi:hypothetical protein
MNNKINWQIVKSDGSIVSSHRTVEAAEKQRQRNLNWRCAICGNNRSGWGKCNHNQLVCSADHYNDRVIGIMADGTIIR